MTNANLLPINSELWERCIADAISLPVQLQDAVTASHTVKWKSPPPSFLPFLVYELGLGELTPYVPNLYNLLDEGVNWQRVRGTPAAISMGLSWIGYSATLEEAPVSRRWWNSFQLRFSALPAADNPDLEQIEGITTLSVPKRSQLRRGVYHYDVGALIADGSRVDAAMPDRESGISTTPKGTIWSFGRTFEIEHTLTRAEGEVIGNWLDPVEEMPLKWVDMNYPWVDAVFLWASSPQYQRAALMAGWFRDRIIYLCLRNASDEVIGYRRCRAVRTVTQQYGGTYQFEDESYDPSPSGQLLYIEALTQFADADDIKAARISIVVNAVLSAGVASGRLWLEPQDLQSGDEIIRTAVSIPLRATVRDQFKFLMRF
ncbi:phage tail protein [Ochrobactrum sp. MR28]|nr:phage tail protein [Ochrobactrum sp. MR28]MBX8814742.1 phage tail protein [Ochrobactrum sp. MR31]